MPPVNDNFADAITISGASGTISGDNTGATEDWPPSEEHQHQTNVWYVWNCPTDGGYQFDTFTPPEAPGVLEDTTLQIFTGTVLADLVLVAEDDDGDDTPDGLGFRSQIIFFAEAGTQYWIEVEGYGDSEGLFELSWEMLIPSVPSENSSYSGYYPTTTSVNISTAAIPNYSAITEFRVYRRTVSGTFSLVATIGISFYGYPGYGDTTFRDLTHSEDYDITADLDQPYYYKIVAVNAQGEGTATEFLVQSDVPNTPSFTWSVTSGNVTLNMSATPRLSLVTSFEIYSRKMASDPWTLVDTVAPTVSNFNTATKSYIDVGPDLPRYYRIRALSDVGASLFSTVKFIGEVATTVIEGAVVGESEVTGTGINSIEIEVTDDIPIGNPFIANWVIIQLAYSGFYDAAVPIISDNHGPNKYPYFEQNRNLTTSVLGSDTTSSLSLYIPLPYLIINGLSIGDIITVTLPGSNFTWLGGRLHYVQGLAASNPRGSVTRTNPLPTSQVQGFSSGAGSTSPATTGTVRFNWTRFVWMFYADGFNIARNIEFYPPTAHIPEDWTWTRNGVRVGYIFNGPENAHTDDQMRAYFTI